MEEGRNGDRRSSVNVEVGPFTSTVRDGILEGNPSEGMAVGCLHRRRRNLRCGEIGFVGGDRTGDFHPNSD